MQDSENNAVAGAYAVLCSAMEHRRPAILTTASPDGRPHATWMATTTSLDFRRLLTLTSPDSCKVANIRRNPHVEWLFTDPGMKQLVYLSGTATILDDIAAIKEAWRLIPDKERAFFLRFFNSGPGFAIVDTAIESVTYCVPEANRKVTISPELLAAQTGEAAPPAPGPCGAPNNPPANQSVIP
jgi:general stress protein 26